MRRTSLAAAFVAVIGVGLVRPAPARAQGTADLAGRWTLDRQLSQFPREVGFGVDWLPAGGAGSGASADGERGRRGGGVQANPFLGLPESEDEAERVKRLTAEVREPAAQLTIVDTAAAVTITDDRGQPRTFHPDGREELLQVDGVPVNVIAKRDAGRLEVVYEVERGRELRYVYSRVANPPRLVVDVQFLDHGKGSTIRRVYEPAGAAVTSDAATTAPSPSTARPGLPVPAAGAAASARGEVPASGARAAGQPVDQQPDADLKGLTALGVVVEGMSPQAAACGLHRSAIEAAVSKRLSDAGFTVLHHSDNDTYVYVNVITTSLSTGLCVSRYDVSLYSETTARLSYQQAPVPVQVSLLHDGGLAGSGSSTHAAEVLQDVLGYVDRFMTRIRNAGK